MKNICTVRKYNVCSRLIFKKKINPQNISFSTRVLVVILTYFRVSEMSLLDKIRFSGGS